MIYVHSLGRAARYYPDRTALAPDATAVSFRGLEARVKGIAAALSQQEGEQRRGPGREGDEGARVAPAVN